MPLPSSILIVDDVAANRETLAALLEGQGYELLEAGDGVEALRLASQFPPDLILLDVMMPGLDGNEVCRRLRADSRLADVPVIMVTALEDQASRITGIEAGADDFVSKPFNRVELRARVRTITRLNRYRRLLATQAALRESEARFQQLAEHSGEVFWFHSVHPVRFIYVSPAVEKTWGVPVGRLYDEPELWTKALHPDDRRRVETVYAAMTSGAAGRFQEEYRVVQPNGTVRWVLDSGTPIRDAAGAIVGAGGVARDITERREAEEQLLRAQRLENIGMLAAGIAHDFNNALAPVIMAGPLLRPHVGDPGAQRILDMVERSAARSAALVRLLLSFARGSSGRGQLLPTRHVLREVVDLAETTFPKTIRVEAHLPGELWPVAGNPTQIHQVLLNLCVNARDAMPAGGELCVRASNGTLSPAEAADLPDARPGKFVIIEVRDSGTGIPPELLGRIWEPFFTTKSEDKGTGLGLSTVRGIVANHNGFVTVTTHAGRGTTFTVYLPAAEDETDSTAPSSAGEAPPRGLGELILVVDDEEPVRTTVTTILTQQGYQTATACDGAEAIAVFAPRASEVRLVLADLQMPVLGGAELAMALRRLNPTLPIMAMSGMPGHTADGLREFATAFLAKPFHRHTLLSMVRRVLDEARLAASAPPAT